MRAIAIEAFGGREQLQLMELPVPAVGPDDVLIAVRAAGVGYWDIAVRENYEGSGTGRTFPLVLGWECSGVVVAAGTAITTLQLGDEVFAYPFQRGCYAEYVAAPEAQVARKPRTLDFAQAALPVSGVTAWQAIHEALGVRAGERLLITGAAGGTGVLAVQLAATRGANVIATARESNHRLLNELGAAEVIDYTRSDYAAVIRATYPNGIDAVLECVESTTGDNFYRSLTTLRPGGRMVSIESWPNHHPLRSDVSIAYLWSDSPNRACCEPSLSAWMRDISAWCCSSAFRSSRPAPRNAWWRVVMCAAASYWSSRNKVGGGLLPVSRLHRSAQRTLGVFGMVER